jgi:hypothetical protein
MNRQALFFEGIIDTINKQLEILRSAGIEIHDCEDFDFCLDYIRYSEASDTVTAYFKQVTEEEEEGYEDRKQIHKNELRRVI